MGLAAAAPSLFDQLPAASETRSTLDALVVAVWRDVRVRGVAACPVCGGSMVREQRRDGSGVRVAAQCTGCGSELA